MRRLRQFALSPASVVPLATVFLLATGSAAPACTTMALGPADAPLVAYSYDQSGTGAGALLINPAGTLRTSIMDGPRAAWEARFASVSFNQFGLGMPTAGMNSEGLVVTLMWNDDVTYPGPDSRPELNELEAIQLMLDTSATVEDALVRLDQVRLNGMIPIQYFLMDAQGSAAALAHIDGEPVISRGLGLPIRALTNTSYVEALAAFGSADPATGVARRTPSAAVTAPTGTGSLGRFAQAARAGRETAHAISTDQAFDILSRVHTEATQWNVVFDPTARTLAFRTTATPGIRTLDLTRIDTTCPQPPLFVDLRDGEEGAVVGRLRPYTVAHNAALTAEAFGSMPQLAAFGPDFPALAAAAQDRSFRCPQQ